MVDTLAEEDRSVTNVGRSDTSRETVLMAGLVGMAEDNTSRADMAAVATEVDVKVKHVIPVGAMDTCRGIALKVRNATTVSSWYSKVRLPVADFERWREWSPESRLPLRAIIRTRLL